MIDQVPETHRGIICPEHGKQGLTDVDYRKQMARPDSKWRCPIPECEAKVRWDDDRYDADR